uniref:Uncharacterized protein n=1 Tax=Glossina palpalis gambiensis TaxID=67801 RepID=A0A1B0C443_9MUSC
MKTDNESFIGCIYLYSSSNVYIILLEIVAMTHKLQVLCHDNKCKNLLKDKPTQRYESSLDKDIASNCYVTVKKIEFTYVPKDSEKLSTIEVMQEYYNLLLIKAYCNELRNMRG